MENILNSRGFASTLMVTFAWKCLEDYVANYWELLAMELHPNFTIFFEFFGNLCLISNGTPIKRSTHGLLYCVRAFLGPNITMAHCGLKKGHKFALLSMAQSSTNTTSLISWKTDQTLVLNFLICMFVAPYLQQYLQGQGLSTQVSHQRKHALIWLLIRTGRLYHEWCVIRHSSRYRHQKGTCLNEIGQCPQIRLLL